MDKRNGPICHPVRRPLSGLSELTPWGQFTDPQPSQRPLLRKTSDSPGAASHSGGDSPEDVANELAAYREVLEQEIATETRSNL